MHANAADIPIADLRRAARRPEVVAGVRAFHAETDARVAARHPICRNRGDCCRFGEFGHRLYVTAIEVAYYLATGAIPSGANDDVCPHACGGVCQARDRRFTGCRIFYCDPAAQSWQGPLTEERLARLRRLHDELVVPYFYADWMTVLQALRDSDNP